MTATIGAAIGIGVLALSREDFKYCGLIEFDGGPKLAFEWDA